METLLGLVMIYVWAHSVVIVVKKVHRPTTYETTVMILGLVSFLLYIVGTAA